MGTVYDAVTLEPLDNATVYCNNTGSNFTTHTVIASVMGFFYYEPVPAGTYRCYASRPAYFPNSNAGYVPPAGMANIDIYLNPTPGGIIGTVYNLANNSVIPGASVVCTADTAQSLPQRTTDGKGFYYVPNVAAARVVCTATVADFAPDTRTGVVVNGFNTTINFYLLELPGSLQVTVVENGTNVPIPNASVTCSASTQTLMTPTNGSVLYTPVSPGNGYSCSASAAGYSSNSLSGIVVVRNRLTAVVIPLNPLPAILTVVTVDNSTKFLLPGASVTVTPGSYSGLTAGGSASIQFTVPAGTYSASATATGYYPGSNNSFTVTKGQSLTVYVYLNPLPGQLVVNVIAADTQQPLPGATVSIQGPSGQSFVSGVSAPAPDARLQYTIFNYGFYRASASASGYSSDSRQSATAVLANTIVNITLILTPLPNQLTVFVRDAQTFVLIPSASVTLNPTGAQVTAPSGTTVFNNLAAGQYTATATAQFYSTNTSTPAVTLGRNESRETTVYLSKLSCTLVVTVLNGATGAVISGASVSLNNNFYTAVTTNPTASFTVFASNPTTVASASASGFLGTGNATFNCAPGTTTYANITLQPIIEVELIIQSTYTSGPLPSAVVVLNGTTQLTAVNSTSSTYRFQVSALPFTASVVASAPGYQNTTRPSITWTTTVRSRLVSLAPVNYEIFFVLYETLTDGSTLVLRGNQTLLNNLADHASDLGLNLNQGYYRPEPFGFSGAVIRYSNSSTSQQNIIAESYSSDGPLSVQATFQPLLAAYLQNTNEPDLSASSAPSNITLLAAHFQSLAPSSSGPFYALVSNVTGFNANFGNLVTGPSFSVNLPDFNVTSVRRVLVPLPYYRSFGFVDVKVVPYALDGVTLSEFRSNNFISVTFLTSVSTTTRVAYPSAQFAVLEYGIPFGTQVYGLPVAYQTEEFDTTKSGYLSGGSIVPGQNVTIPGVTSFTFPPANLLTSLYTVVNGQYRRNPSARLYTLLEYRLIRTTGKRQA
jgi:hypothetical protein